MIGLQVLTLWLPVLLSGSTAKVPADSALVGTWEFVKEVDRHADGTQAEDSVPAAGYDGMVIYTSDGHMSGQLIPRGRTWRLASAKPEELRSTVELSTSYFGTYSIDRATATVTHHVEASLDPSESGKDLKRHYRFAGDQLVMTGIWEYQGEPITFEITFKRAE